MFTDTVIPLAQFNREQMGAKSNNLRILSTNVPSWVNLPESICLPFQMMEYALQGCDPVGNARIARLINRLSKTKKLEKMSARLIRCKQIVLALEFNPKDAKLAQMKSLILAFGVPEAEFPKAWASIKKVWASKFNERAFLAVKKIGVRLDQVFMAVLIQKIVRAKYAFVIHTANPTNGEENEVYVEACRGLGESLVSDMPGAALSFTVLKEPAIQAAASQG